MGRRLSRAWQCSWRQVGMVHVCGGSCSGRIFRIFLALSVHFVALFFVALTLSLLFALAFSQLFAHRQGRRRLIELLPQGGRFLG